MSAPAVMFNTPLPTALVPSTSSWLLVRWTSLAPLLDRLTAPVNWCAWVRVIGLAPAAKLEVPGTVSAPVWLIAPLATMVRFCPTLDVARLNATPSVRATSFAPLLESVTAPVKLLPACVSVIGLAPALKLDTPLTVSAPVCVIAPLAVSDRTPNTLDAASETPPVFDTYAPPNPASNVRLSVPAP